MEQEHDVKTNGLVLLVDDDTAFLRVMARALSQSGFSVWPAETVQDAKSAVDSITPDYAVVDLHLGDGNGLDVVDHIGRTCPKTVSIILSGYANLATAVDAVKLGAIDCLPKPVDVDDLVQTLTSGAEPRPAIPDTLIAPSEARLQHILAHWEKNDRNTMKTAQLLGMHRRTLQRILNKVGMGREGGRQSEKPSRFGKLRRLYLVWSRHVTGSVALTGRT